MAKSAFEKKSNEFKSQLQDVRDSLDDLMKSYNRLLSTGSEWLAVAPQPVAQIAKQARQNVEEATGGMTGGRMAWWTPLAVLGGIGVAMWLYNKLTSGAATPDRGQYPNYPAGSQPPAPAPGSSFPEQH
jgi:hypothetical protein